MRIQINKGIVALACLLSACATPIDISVTPPPNANSSLVEIESTLRCATRPDGLPATRTDVPLTLRACWTTYPQTPLLAELMAACRVLFDVDQTGVPEVLDTRCEIEGVNGPKATQWREYAEHEFGAHASAAMHAHRFAAVDNSKSGETRVRLSKLFVFRFEGECVCVDPPQFDNSTDLGPARPRAPNTRSPDVLPKPSYS